MNSKGFISRLLKSAKSVFYKAPEQKIITPPTEREVEFVSKPNIWKRTKNRTKGAFGRPGRLWPLGERPGPKRMKGIH